MPIAERISSQGRWLCSTARQLQAKVETCATTGQRVSSARAQALHQWIDGWEHSGVAAKVAHGSVTAGNQAIHFDLGLAHGLCGMTTGAMALTGGTVQLLSSRE